MRKFVITEKNRPWLWEDDVVLYHNRCFLVIKAQSHMPLLEPIREYFYKYFIMFDKSFFEHLIQMDISTIANMNQCHYFHCGLPLVKNKRIFVPDINENVTFQNALLLLQEKYDSIAKSATIIKKYGRIK